MKTLGIALILCGLAVGIGGAVYGYHISQSQITTTPTGTTKNGTCNDGPIYDRGSTYFSNNSTLEVVLNGTATLTRAVILDPYGNTVANQTVSVALARSTAPVYLTATLTLHTTYTVVFTTTCENKYPVSVTP